MKFRNTVQLGALLVLLILGYFLWGFLNQKQEQGAQEAKKIFSFAPEDIRKVTVHRLDEGPTVGVRAEDGTWSIAEPNPSIKPNVALWERLAAQTARLMNERSLGPDATDLESYGLDVPRLTIGVAAGGQDYTLRFGYLDPTQTLRYARLDEGPVFLVDKSAVFELDRPVDLLRDAFIVADHESPVLRLEFARIMTEEEFQKQLKTMESPPPPGTESDVLIIEERPSADEPWLQLSPIHTAANQEKVNELVKEIQYARGRNYVDAPEAYADYGLDPATARITIENGGTGGRQTFFFGDSATAGNDSGVYVRKEGEPAVFMMDGQIVALFPRINSLRERRLMTHQARDITKLEFIGREFSYTLVQDKTGAWSMADPPLDDLEDGYISQYISALKSLEGIQFYPGGPAEYGLDDPDMRLRFHLADRDAPVEIRFTPDPVDPSHYYALTDAGEVAAVPADSIQFLKADAQQFRLMSMLRFPVNRATAMNFQIKGVDYALKKEHNRWLVTVPENNFMPNQRDADTLLTAVASLRAVGTEEGLGEDPANYGFDAPRFTFTVTLAPDVAEEAPVTVGPLEIGAVVPGIDQQRFARSAQRKGVFRVKQSFIEAVEQAVSGIRAAPGGGRNSN